MSTRMIVEFVIPDAEQAGRIAAVIEDAVGEFDVDGIEWDTEDE